MTAATRVRVSSRTAGDSLITRDTVFLETFARRAMSLMVYLRSGSAGFGARVLATALRALPVRPGAGLPDFFFRMRFVFSNEYRPLPALPAYLSAAGSHNESTGT